MSWGSLWWYEQSCQPGRAGSCRGGVAVPADRASGSSRCVAALRGSAARSPSCLSCCWCAGPAARAGWGCASPRKRGLTATLSERCGL